MLIFSYVLGILLNYMVGLYLLALIYIKYAIKPISLYNVYSFDDIKLNS